MRIDIQKQLEKFIKQKGVVGAALGYIEQRNIQFYFAGKSSAEQLKPISIESIFEIGSITKVFTILLLKILSSKGLLDLDHPIDMYLSCKTPQFNGHKITLKHLATHSSGLPSFPHTYFPQNPKNPYQGYTLKHLYHCLEECHLESIPGESFLYSNLGVGLLAHILSIKTGQSYQELLLEHVLEPLAMTRSLVQLTPSIGPNTCMGHNIGKIVGNWDTPEAIVGSGGLRSTIKDMTQFLAANLGLIESPISNLLKECHNKIINTDILDEYCGLGWIISDAPQGEIIWHDGITGGFTNFIALDKQKEKGIVILTNSRKNGLRDFSFSILGV